jgi:hypothetical protein
MNAVDIQMRLDNPEPVYLPGDMLTGSYRLAADDMSAIKAVELSVLWCTSGKGDQDMGVHFFEKRMPENGLDFGAEHRFSTLLPHSPLSFDGIIVKIGWCVRARVLVAGGKEVVHQESFRLGTVAAPREVS